MIDEKVIYSLSSENENDDENENLLKLINLLSKNI